MNEGKENDMEMTEGERAIREKLDSPTMHDPLTSEDLLELHPETDKEYAMVLLAAMIASLKYLEQAEMRI